MKVKGTAKLIWEEQSHLDALKIKVKFKLPNKLFQVTRIGTLCSSWWDEYETYQDFLNDCKRKLYDKRLLELEAKNMIINYLKQKEMNQIKNQTKETILQLIEDNKEFTVEVEVEGC